MRACHNGVATLTHLLPQQRMPVLQVEQVTINNVIDCWLTPSAADSSNGTNSFNLGPPSAANSTSRPRPGIGFSGRSRW